jgi:membrane-associated phospholipid phosphatase
MGLRDLLGLIILISLVGPAYGEVKSPAHAPENEISDESFREFLWNDLKSPFHPQALPTLEAGTLLTAGVYLLKYSEVIPSQQDIQEQRPLGKYSALGDSAGQWIPNVSYYLLTMGGGLLRGDKEMRYWANFMLRTTAYASLAVVVLKTVIREERPNLGDNQQSFPSGHAATSFAFAEAVWLNNSWYWGIPAYALAGFVGFSRMNDSYHYLHDVVAGATIGISYSLGLYYLDRDRRRNSANHSEHANFQLAPLPIPDGTGILARYEF